MKLRHSWLVILVVSMSVGALNVAQASARTTSMTTRVVHVKPFLPSGGLAPGYMVASSAKGHCWTNSIASNRPDAFRCVVGNEIYDPCFKNPAGTKVACIYGSSSEVAIIRLTSKLPKAMSGGTPHAFLVQLANGTRCEFETGATFVADGRRANFSCTDKSWLFGHADTSTQPWRIRQGRGMHPNVKWVDISTAWF